MKLSPPSSVHAQAPRPRGRVPRWLWWLTMVLVSLGLLASIAAILARNRVDARLASLSARLGVELELGSLSLSTTDGILLRDLSARAGAGAPALREKCDPRTCHLQASRKVDKRDQVKPSRKAEK